MAVDARYKHGLSWLSNEDDESCSKKILRALYAAIYDENGDRDVVRSLLRAYEAQWSYDHPDKEEPKGLKGDEALAYMRRIYMAEALPRMQREGFAKTEDDLAEVFEWPQSIPYDWEIRVGILKTVAIRLAAADLRCYKEMRQYAQSKEGVEQ